MSREALADAAYCHAVLARSVEHPGHRVPGDGSELSDLKALRLRQMAGLITKVRHNAVRRWLPLTMRSLAAAGLEIDFFADHAPEFTARRREGLTDEQRTSLFVTSLRRWLQPDDDAHRLVADVLAHEMLLLELAERAPVPPPDANAIAGPGSTPRLREGVRILHLSVHPPDVANVALATSDPLPVDRSPRSYAYIPTPAGPRVKSVPPELAPLLELADGSATIEQIAAALGLSAAVDDVADVFQVWARKGLADVEQP